MEGAGTAGRMDGVFLVGGRRGAARASGENRMFIGANAMRSFLALGLLITLCASASAATRQALGKLETSLDGLGEKSAIWNQNYSRIAALIRQIAAHLP